MSKLESDEVILEAFNLNRFLRKYCGTDGHRAEYPILWEEKEYGILETDPGI